MWLALLLVSLFSVADIFGYYISHGRNVFWICGLGCFAILKATIFWCAIELTRQKRVLHIAMWCATALFAFLSILNFGSFILYDMGISRKLVTIFYETNKDEVRQFVAEMRGDIARTVVWWKLVTAIVAFVAAWVLLPRLKSKLRCILLSLTCCAGMVYFGWYCITADWGKTWHLISLRSAIAVRSVAGNMAAIKEMSQQRRVLPYKESARSNHLAKRVVIVIGESASRDHHSLYGYPLTTTPKMDSLRSSLFIFDDAVASSTTTAENLPRLLSFMTDEPGQGEWYEYPTLMNLFKTYGYSTAWLSNQERTGDWSNLSGILSADADVVKYLGSMDSEDHITDRYDDVLLPAFRKQLAAKDSLQLIFMHLMGSHIVYDERYPKDRTRFTYKDILEKATRRNWLDKEKAETVAHYDNSIAFTDSILSVVTGIVAGLPEPAIMLYLSDHGENVFDDRDFRGRDPRYVRVPFFIYVNRAYAEGNQGIVQKLKEAETLPFSTSSLINMLITLTGSEYCHYDPTRDILSPSFTIRQRFVDDEPYN